MPAQKGDMLYSSKGNITSAIKTSKAYLMEEMRFPGLFGEHSARLNCFANCRLPQFNTWYVLNWTI